MFEAGQDDEAVKVESDMQIKIDELEKHVISDEREAKDVEDKLTEPKQFSDESQVEEFKALEVECFEPVISKDVKATDAAPSEILAASTHNEESEEYDFVHEDTTDKIPTVQLNFKEIKALVILLKKIWLCNCSILLPLLSFVLTAVNK
ncbi:unnamed protein product [Clavelina lepadiformis]|uniref:Uncharacterized protein n=1 Tax=Clavelina lepadiformis TaxID=159417 RepID=A0ABP0FDS3_CLALP